MKRTILGFGLACSLVAGGAAGTLAQSAGGLDPDASVPAAEQPGSISQGALSNPVRLLQELQALPNRSVEEFAQEQDGQLDDAGAQFRRMQLERLGCPQPGNGQVSTNPACAPQPQ